MFQQAVDTRPVAPVSHAPYRDLSFEFQSALLFAAIENFADGLVIVNRAGSILHQNRCASQLLKAIDAQRKQTRALPPKIWQVCQSLLNHSDLYALEANIILEDEIQLDTQGTVRLRVQWFNSDSIERDCLLVTLENRARSAESYAITDAQRYGLTPREAEVWQLKRADYSYKAIAAELYISENTVKKHLKSVYAKRDGWGDEEMRG
ncbi:MAG: helix-turn-helix transcriptional regulator [Leptolyngbya sp. SIO4C1]|nr:helix-turn-helix transcriptional regulator [Leptolyngbya sp. SIO4C1]